MIHASTIRYKNLRRVFLLRNIYHSYTFLVFILIDCSKHITRNEPIYIYILVFSYDKTNQLSRKQRVKSCKNVLSTHRNVLNAETFSNTNLHWKWERKMTTKYKHWEECKEGKFCYNNDMWVVFDENMQCLQDMMKIFSIQQVIMPCSSYTKGWHYFFHSFITLFKKAKTS